MSTPPPASIQTLVADALHEASDLVSKELTLFRTEMLSNVRSLFIGLGMMIAAAVFAITAMLVLVGALVKFVATLVGSDWLAALIVGGVLLVIAVILVLVGANAMSMSKLAPKRTTRQVRQDARALSERVSG